MRTIQAFTLYQFHVRVLVCDGASSNLAFMKLLCGCEHEQLPLADADDQLAVSASLKIIHGFKLTSHQPRYMISALQEHARRTPLPADASMVEMTSNFFEACHLIFEKGILSHMTVSPK